MDFLRRLLGGGEPQPKARPGPRGRQELTSAAEVVAVGLDPSWPIIPARREARSLGTDERNELPYEATLCPSCGVSVAKPPKGRKKCTRCREYMFVRVIDFEFRRLVTEADARVIDEADAARQSADWDDAEREWHAALVAVGLHLGKAPAEDGVELEVVGESHYHADLAGLMASLRSDPDSSEAWTAARLVRDPQNPYDRNAVRVEIHGRMVGHLTREDAEDIQPWLRKLERQGRPAHVLTRLGGGRVSEGRIGPIGVTLMGLPEDVLG